MGIKYIHYSPFPQVLSGPGLSRVMSIFESLDPRPAELSDQPFNFYDGIYFIVQL